ncbi:MAG TPA: PadR family transcriptional regulator [Methanospirillum sp.]|nr:PadR family transcriptional regulator [Methanospirillum sp.]
METALLGLLSEKPMYPYEIEKKVVEHDMRYWTEISLSSIYKVLEKLEKKFLVDVNLTVTETNKVKKIYTLTEKGDRELKERIVEIMSELEISIFQIDLALANLHILTPAEVNEVMAKYITSIDSRITCYLELEQYLIEHECEVGNIHLSRRRQYLIRAEREWAQQFLEEYNAKKGYTPDSHSGEEGRGE